MGTTEKVDGLNKGEKYDIIILAGQSNAYGCGVGDFSQGYSENDETYMMKDKYNVSYKTDSDGKVYLSVKEPTSYFVEKASEIREEGTVGNLCLYFAELYRKNNLKKGRKILIINSAVGGTGFAKGHWGVGESLYRRAVNMTKIALAANPENRIVSFLWHQGEHDAFENIDLGFEERREFYYVHFTEMINSYRKTFNEPELPVIVGKFAEEWYKKNKIACDAVYDAYKKATKNLKNVSLVETKGLKSNNEETNNGDDIHFSRKSLCFLGRKYYSAYRAIKGAQAFSSKAKWIWINKADEKNQYADFITELYLDKNEEKYYLRLSVAGNYCVYINDKFVSCARFDDYPEYKMYDEVEITDYLHDGKNIILFTAYTMYGWSGRSVTMPSGFIAEIYDSKGKFYYNTDENTLSRESKNYRSGEDVPKIGNGNSYSADINLIPFSNDCFEKSRLSEGEYSLTERENSLTVIGGEINETLVSQGVFKVEESLTIAKKLQRSWLSFRSPEDLTDKNVRYSFPSSTINFKSEGENIFLLFDFKSEQNGYVTFDFVLYEDADVEFAFGEHLDDLRVRSEIETRNFTSVIHAKKGRNVFTDYMNRIGCRYMQVYFYVDKIGFNYFGLKYNYYPVNVYEYKTDNLLRKKIYETSVKTLRECMHEHYEDCPWREQALYAMDSRNQMLCGYYVFKEYEFPRANLELLFKRRRPNNQLLLTPPTDSWLVIPSFTLVAFLSLFEYTEYSRDISLVQKLIPELTEIIDTFVSRVNPKNSLLERYPDDEQCIWNFYEWTEGMWNNWGDHPIKKGSIEYPTVLNAFFAVALKCYCSFLKKVGKDYERYGKLLNSLLKSIDDTFWDEKKQCFAAYETDGKLSHYNELANSMALFCGAGSENHRKIVAEKLMNDNTLTPATLSMTIYKYQALIEFDANNLKYVLRDIDVKWGYMLFNNATTFWETIKGGDDFNFAGSLCHGWSAIPAYFYKKYEEK